jgi:DNA-binding GntR family transcriptional regulator
MNKPTPSPKDQLADHLRQGVLTLALPPGADLDEVRLSEEFGLSRTPLREVFRALAGEGYLDLRAGRGARVSDMSMTTLRDFFLAAPMIYAAVLRLAAQNATQSQITALKAAQTQFEAALHSDNTAQRALANNRFHDITGEMAQNTYLLPSFKRLLIDHARIAMTFYNAQTGRQDDDTETASQHHHAMINAIIARDADTAEDLAHAHWQLSRGHIERFVMPGALDLPLGASHN